MNNNLRQVEAFLIDDDPISVLVAKKMMEKSGFHPTPSVFENGKKAIDYFSGAFNPDYVYIIFLDINMPVMNGWEFLEAIEAFANPENTFVFMVTSSTDEADIQRASKSRFVNGFVEKPIMADRFIALMSEHPLQPIYNAK